MPRNYQIRSSFGKWSSGTRVRLLSEENGKYLCKHSSTGELIPNVPKEMLVRLRKRS